MSKKTIKIKTPYGHVKDYIMCVLFHKKNIDKDHIGIGWLNTENNN